MDRREFAGLISGLLGFAGMTGSVSRPVKTIEPLRAVVNKMRRQEICGGDLCATYLSNGIVEFNRPPNSDCTEDVDRMTEIVRKYLPELQPDHRRMSSMYSMSLDRKTLMWAILDKEKPQGIMA